MFPAYAGMILKFWELRFCIIRVPRLRGDDPGLYSGKALWMRVPRLRGDDPKEVLDHLGVSECSRLRGDDPGEAPLRPAPLWCSPPTRG